ncbi:MAG: hypothetical protein DRP34_00225 [Thermodesulfobacteriota bacterium]|nr:MAG: hypothetical protein DRP34_00225 [Thermodesulfobacteriota bacterium]
MLVTVRRSWFELVLAIVGIIIGYIFVFDQKEFIAMLGRKVGLCGLLTFVWYAIRRARIGMINWNEKGEWRKIYALVLLIAYAIVIALG